MGIVTTWAGQNDNWNRPGNWSNGVPLPGDTAIVGTAGSASPFFNGSLFGVGVQLANGGLLSGTLMTLVSSTVTNTPGTGTGTLNFNTLIVGSNSIIFTGGHAESFQTLNVEGNALINHGVISDLTAATIQLTPKNLVNDGHINVYESALFISGGSLSGAGSLNLSFAADVTLEKESISAGTNIDFQQSGVALLDLDVHTDSNLVGALIGGFGTGNIIELDNFAAAHMAESYSASSNTTNVTFTQSHGPSTSLTFAGNYTHGLKFTTAGQETLVTHT
jgi:hypothetical protein